MTKEDLLFQLRGICFSAVQHGKAVVYLVRDENKNIVGLNWLSPESIEKEGDKYVQRWEGMPEVRIDEENILIVEDRRFKL